MKRTLNYYPDELKLKVVQEYLETNLSQESLKKKYGIRGKNCINYWMQKFSLKKPTQQQLNIQLAMSKEVEKTKYELELETKVRELEKSLDYERLKTLALNTMIDIAERDLKISIRKKHGTKQ